MANHHTIIKYKIMNMKISGLKKLEKKVIKNGDLVASYKTYSLGDGLWSIELEADDLYASIFAWRNKINHSYMEYRAPDGSRGSYKYFYKEVLKGRLHGLIVSV